MAAPKRIDELSSAGSLSAGAAIAVVQSNDTFKTTPRAIITEAESFTQTGTGATSETVQNMLRLTVHPEQFGASRDGITNDAASIQAALDRAAASGAGGCVELGHGAYNLGTTTLSIPNKVTLKGKSRESSFLVYTGSGTAIDIDSVSQWGVKDLRIGLGSSGTIIAVNIRTTSADVRWGEIRNIEIAPASISAGQKGIQVVGSGGHIVSDNWFRDITFFGVDKPIIRTDTEGNFWSGIDIDTWGATASTNAIDSQSHAEFMQARVAGIPSGGSGVAYKQSANSNIDNIVVDIGAANTALNVTGTGNAITLSRTGGTTPVGTIVAGNALVESQIGGVVQIIGKSAVATNAPADTNENTLATVTVPARALGSNGAIRLKAFYTYTNSGNSKTLRIKFGGTTFIAVARTSQQSSFFEVTIANRNATNSQVAFGSYGTHGDNTLTTYNSAATGAVDTTSAQSLTLTGQKASGAETITLEAYTVELLRP